MVRGGGQVPRRKLLRAAPDSDIFARVLTPRGERMLSVGESTLAALCYGREDGAPVLALHGWLDNAASFARLAAQLDGVNLVALDLAGHGGSSRRADGVYLFIDFVADVAGAVRALGWSRCAVVGHSLGAGVGALFAGTCPEVVSRLVLLEGLGPLTNPDEQAPRRLREALAAEAAARGRDEHAGYADAGEVARRLADATGMRRDSAEILLARGLERGGAGHRWRADPRLRLPSRMRLTEAQVLAFLRAIACPTLVVRARPGMPFDEAQAAARVEAIADVRVAEVAGGHHVHLDDPAAVAALVGPFLAAG